MPVFVAGVLAIGCRQVLGIHELEYEADAAAPEASPSCLDAASCNGFWAGTTSQGERLRFEMRSDRLAMVWFDWRFDSCGTRGSITSEFMGGMLLSGDRSLVSGEQSDAEITYALTGGFTGSRSAEGSVMLSHSIPSCGDLNIQWEAEQTACGDGELTWPETCEIPNSPLLGDCSEACQSPAIREMEGSPGALASAAASTLDTVYAGAISPAGDQDLFEIHNDSARARNVRLSVYGATVGVCSIDPVLVLFNADGGQINYADGGGRGTCPELTADLQAEVTIFARVESKEPDSVLPGYHLVIDFEE